MVRKHMTRVDASKCVIMQSRSKLPLTLVLGMSTSSAALGQILAGGGADVLTPRSFRLPGSLALLEALFREVFASRECGLLFGHSLLRALDDHFMHHDFTVRSFQQGLKVTQPPGFERTLLTLQPHEILPILCGC